MRFDDSLRTVLAADDTTPFGAESAFRQLVDLIGRGRAPADAAALERLRGLRSRVPVRVRTAAARALAYATPPAALAAFFAEDEMAVAAPVLRMATLAADDWIALLPALGPAGRAILRHRRDLGEPVQRALAAFGATDFVLGDARADAAPAEVAEAMPAIAETMRRGGGEPLAPAPFEIAELVARIAAFQKERGAAPATPLPAEAVSTDAPARFRWAAGVDGRVSWVEGVARAALIGLSIAGQGDAVDGTVSGAFRRRDRFADGRLAVGGEGEAGGAWRITGAPTFDAASGRFTGYRGVARRPRRDECVARPRAAGDADALRRLVHELRTPANAIVGFAELIGSELLGPVDPAYRRRAGTIQAQALELVSAIEDLDTAARIDDAALELRPTTVALVPVLSRAIDDLAELAAIRGCTIDPAPVPDDLAVVADDRAVERLVSRLLAALVSAGSPGERIGVAVRFDPDGLVALAIDRPAALGMLAGADDQEAEAPGAPLLGTGFALRLAQNLAGQLGGSLAIGEAYLTLRLPGAYLPAREQAAAT